ncbi:caspase family protein [Nisaea sediminum]|uniref:caspase family protein n=1 Tax=Nisaea sediminum TaxID=2775867 RepID=UPI0018691092|nr:caspase family protein [Nisaea sediminum]
MSRIRSFRLVPLLLAFLVAMTLRPGVAPAATNGKAFALIIGIDAYDRGWPRLRNAVSDAKAVADTLGTLGFEVELRTNVTGEELHRLLLEFFVIKGADPEARLLLWYAGHGETIDGEGYLVPRDAPISAKPQFLLAATPVRMLGSYVRLAQARHVLAIFDSCFAGTIFESRSAPAAQTIARMSEPVREFLTSGDAGQRVRDDGSFRDYFLRGITGEIAADFNSDGYVTGAELGLYMSQKITELTGSAQTPQYGKLHDIRFNRGDFAFAVGGASIGSDSPSRRDQDGLFWDSVRWSMHAAEYEAYLQQFPDGMFAALAKERLSRLRAGEPLVGDTIPGLWPLDQSMVIAGSAPVNIRGWPNQNAPLLKEIRPGTDVTVTGKTTNGEWFQTILQDGRTGYLLGTYLVDKTETAPAGPGHALQATFGPPVNETVTIRFNPRQPEIRHTAYLKSGAIAWFDGDIYADEMALSIFVDSPDYHSVAPTFRHVFNTAVPNSVTLENLTPEAGRAWADMNIEYKTLNVQVAVTIR